MACSWNDAMGASARELGRARFPIGRGSDAIPIAIERYRRHRNRRQHSEAPLDLGIMRIAIGESKAMTVAVNHDIDIVRIVMRHDRPLETCIVELPVWRPLLP